VKQINKINTLLRNNMQQRASKYHSFQVDWSRIGARFRKN